MLADVVPVGLQFAELQWPYILSCNLPFAAWDFVVVVVVAVVAVAVVVDCQLFHALDHVHMCIWNGNTYWTWMSFKLQPNPQSNFSWPFGTTPSQCRTYTACRWCSSLTDVHHAHARSIDQNGHMYSGRLVRTGRTLHETLALFASPHILLKLPSPKRGPRRGELARTPKYWPINQIDWSGLARTRCAILFLPRR